MSEQPPRDPNEIMRSALRTGISRSRHGRLLGGVCAGLARRTGVNAWIFRLAFIAGNFLPGPGVIVYVALWALLPLED